MLKQRREGEGGGGSSRIESVIELETVRRLDWIKRLNGQSGEEIGF